MSEKKYIDLDNVIDILENEWGYQGMREELYDLPTADVAEIRHGEWIDALGDCSTAECSLCGEMYDVTDREPEMKYLEAFRQFYKFCPACGAKMDAEVQERQS